MNDLTEQWKKGELPCGWYYIKIADIVFIDFFEGKVWKNKKDEYIDEVLAPVHTFEEWQEKLRALDAAYETIKIEDETINRLVRSGKQCNYENAQLKEQINHLLKTQARQFVDNQKLQVKAEKAKDVVNIDTARQIKQLKELLKECFEFIDWTDGTGSPISQQKLLDKIDEALR